MDVLTPAYGCFQTYIPEKPVAVERNFPRSPGAQAGSLGKK